MPISFQAIFGWDYADYVDPGMKPVDKWLIKVNNEYNKVTSIYVVLVLLVLILRCFSNGNDFIQLPEGSDKGIVREGNFNSKFNFHATLQYQKW